MPDAAELRAVGLIGGVERTVLVRYGGGRCRLQLDEPPIFELGPSAIGWTVDGVPPTYPLAEMLFGPALLLFLAVRGRFALHGSAVQLPDGRCVLFLADSGAGKSTLAAAADAAGLVALADDIVIVSRDGNGLVAWPWFPQLKLPADRQYGGAHRPEAVPVAALCLLERTLPDAAPVLRPVGAREAALAVQRQVVAARLMAPRLLASQFRTLAALPPKVRCWRLAVPWRRSRVSAVLRAVAVAAQGAEASP